MQDGAAQTIQPDDQIHFLPPGVQLFALSFLALFLELLLIRWVPPWSGWSPTLPT